MKSKKKYKLKTRRGAAKRMKANAAGKFKRKRSNLRHILTSKSTTQKRRLRSGAYVDKADEGRIKQLLPYQV
ncbi:MAG: 50S ribosomal protein L35 [Pseudomonadota bacterium]